MHNPPMTDARRKARELENAHRVSLGLEPLPDLVDAPLTPKVSESDKPANGRRVRRQG